MTIYEALSPLEVAVSGWEACYAVHPSDHSVILILFNQPDYHRTTVKAENESQARQVVLELNTELGISKEVEEAMLSGSMFGWMCPAAEPARIHFGNRRAANG